MLRGRVRSAAVSRCMAVGEEAQAALFPERQRSLQGRPVEIRASPCLPRAGAEVLPAPSMAWLVVPVVRRWDEVVRVEVAAEDKIPALAAREGMVERRLVAEGAAAVGLRLEGPAD